MILHKIALCAAVALTTFAIAAIATVFFGTVRFLYIIGKLEKKVIALNLQLVQQAKEAVVLESDLALSRQAIQCSKCNCTE